MRNSIREPIPEIFEAGQLMAAAVDAHLAGNYSSAGELFRAAASKVVWDWLNDTWVGVRKNVVNWHPAGDSVDVPPSARDPDRNIDGAIRALVLKRDGHRCRYCGLPVVHADIRKIANHLYPRDVPWNSRVSAEQHAGFQALWLQFDHVIPHSHGGRSSVENVVVACAACNFGKDKHTLQQLDLGDPFARDPVKSEFDGLERLRVVGRLKDLRDCTDRISGRVALEVLAGFASKFSKRGVTFGQWMPARPVEGKPDFTHPGYFSHNSLFDEFHSAMYMSGWVADIDYTKWMSKPAAKRLMRDPRAIAVVDVDSLLLLTTVLLRGEHWSEGYLAEKLADGTLLAVAERADVILRQEEATEGKLGHYAMV